MSDGWYRHDYVPDVWLKDNPELSVYHEVARGGQANRGWCWAAWGDTPPNDIIASGEGYKSKRKAMEAADAWVAAGAKQMENVNE